MTEINDIKLFFYNEQCAFYSKILNVHISEY